MKTYQTWSTDNALNGFRIEYIHISVICVNDHFNDQFSLLTSITVLQYSNVSRAN